MATRSPSSRLPCGTLATAGLALVAGCRHPMASVHPAGPQAERISDLTWYLTWTGTAVFVAVVGFLFYALWKARRRTDALGGPEVERRMRIGVGAAVGVTVLILLATLVYNFYTGRALAQFAEPDALTVRVTGHQWWWDVQYMDPRFDRRVSTANEIHIPVGRRIRVEVQSRDVNHSFWVPSLHGKIDLIPGYGGTTYFQADTPGVYQGRCAEFCGMQHANMNFLVVADPPERFAAWYEAQLRSGAAPADSMRQVGQQVFLSRSCAMCHTVRGTATGSRIGPDLTHVGSRHTLGAGRVPNTRGHLAGWVIDPQRIKPGVKMPPNQLSPSELHALLDYLQSLK